MTLRLRIENSFTYHPPRDGQPETYKEIRDAAKELAFLLADNVPEGRELSIAITKLEEVVMWANKGIACHEEDPF